MKICHVLSGTSLFSFLTKIGIINCLLGVWTKLWDFEQNYKKLWKTHKMCHFSQTPTRQKEFLFAQNWFYRNCVFSLLVFWKNKIRNPILHRTERPPKSSYRNPHRDKTQKCVSFFTGESSQYDYLVMFHHSKSDSKNRVFIEKWLSAFKFKHFLTQAQKSSPIL